MFTLTAIVVEQQSFPGNLLIGYDTMRDEHITIIPAREGVKISYKFLPFVNTHSQNFVATASQPHTPEAITAYRDDNVAERYLNNSLPALHEEKTNPPQATKHSKQCTSRNLENCFRFCNRIDTVAGSVDLQGKS